MHLLVCHPNHSWYFFILSIWKSSQTISIFWSYHVSQTSGSKLFLPCFRSVTEHHGVLAICKHLKLHMLLSPNATHVISLDTQC